MTLHRYCLALISVSLLVFGMPGTGMAAPDDLRGQGESFVQLLAAGNFTAAVAGFDATMQKAMPEKELQATWDKITQQFGRYKAIRATRQDKLLQFMVVVVTCEFEKAALDIQVAYDTAGKIAGLYVRPAQSSVPYKSPDYVHPATFHEEEMTVGAAPWALPGTLTLPKGAGPFRAVVLVHGSGPNDRDESIGPNKPFRDLAWGLASRGIAVLRYEKRTRAHQQQFTPTIPITVKEETTDDALAAVALLRRQKDIDVHHLFVLGHSLGGMLAPRIGKADPEIAGLIIMAGLTRPLEDALLAQMTYIKELNGPLSDADKSQLAVLQQQVAKIKDPGLAAEAPTKQILSVPACYWLDLRGYRPALAAQTYPHPMLILQGERDYQVTMDDFLAWQHALGTRKNVTCKSYPALNHLFIAGAGKCTPDEYEQPGHVAGLVVDDLAKWVMAQ